METLLLKQQRCVKVEIENTRDKQEDDRHRHWEAKAEFTKLSVQIQCHKPEQIRFIDTDPCAMTCSGVPQVWVKIYEGLNSL